MTRNVFRAFSAAISAVGLLGLAACGAGSDDDAVSSHTIQLPDAGGPSVSGVHDENGELAAIEIGDTRVLLTQRIGSVSGGGNREAVGPILRNGRLLVRHIESHWDRRTDAVAKFDHISYGAWATVSGPDGNNFSYETIGGAYLIAPNDARTPPADMPATGTATYRGQGTAFIRGHGGGVAHGTTDVTMIADFANAGMTVDILSTRNSRAVLVGAIDGNGFSGTTIDRITDGGTAFQAAGATARFSGGFYGGGAVEAGGVYEIVCGRAQDPGRIVGTFGGRKAE